MMPSPYQYNQPLGQPIDPASFQNTFNALNPPRRDNYLLDVALIAAGIAIGAYVQRHWWSKRVRFFTGYEFGYVIGLGVFGAMFSGNQSWAALWAVLFLPVLPAIGAGWLFAKFAGKGAEQRHQAQQ